MTSKPHPKKRFEVLIKKQSTTYRLLYVNQGKDGKIVWFCHQPGVGPIDNRNRPHKTILKNGTAHYKCRAIGMRQENANGFDLCGLKGVYRDSPAKIPKPLINGKAIGVEYKGDEELDGVLEINADKFSRWIYIDVIFIEPKERI